MAFKPRIILTGDASAGARWIGVAKRLANLVVPKGSTRRQIVVGDATIQTEVRASGMSVAYIHAGTGLHPFLSVVWEPEGLLLTPRSRANPRGFGPPRRAFTDGSLINPPFGTRLEGSEEVEALNQCLLNRFSNNKYLDKLSHTQGLPKEGDENLIDGLTAQQRKQIKDAIRRFRNKLRSPYRFSSSVGISKSPGLPFLCYGPIIRKTVDENTLSDSFWNSYNNEINWTAVSGVQQWVVKLKNKPLLYPKEEDWVAIDNLMWRQFESSDYSSDNLIFEEEGSSWYCHWPEELLYEADAFEAIYQKTNEYRAEVGKAPLIRELRGFCNPARLVLQETQRAEAMFHDSDRYRPGFRTFEERTYVAGTNRYFSGENITTGHKSGRFKQAAGEAAAESWKNSPPHYAIMTHAVWDTPKHSTSLDIFGGVSQQITEAGPPKNEHYDPPLDGIAFAQVFTQRLQWLYAGTNIQYTVYGSVSYFGSDSPVCSSAKYATAGGKPWYVCYKGRLFYVDPVVELTSSNVNVAVLGATLFLYQGVLHFRVVVLCFDLNPSAPRHNYVVRCYRHPVNNWSIDLPWVLEDEKVLEFCIEANSTAAFNPVGTRGVFSYAKVVLDFAPTIGQQHGLSYGPGSEFSKMARAITVHMEIVDGSFQELEEVHGPEFTYTIDGINFSTGDVDGGSYTQQGSGEVNLWPAYNADGDLVYVKCIFNHYSRIFNGISPGSPNYEYSTSVSYAFASGKTVELEKIRCDIFYAEETWGFSEPSFVSMVLYLNQVTEDIVYLKFVLSHEPKPPELPDTYYIQAVPQLIINDTVVKSWPKLILCADSNLASGALIGVYPAYISTTSIKGLLGNRPLAWRNLMYIEGSLTFVVDSYLDVLVLPKRTWSDFASVGGTPYLAKHPGPNGSFVHFMDVINGTWRVNLFNPVNSDVQLLPHLRGTDNGVQWALSHGTALAVFNNVFNVTLGNRKFYTINDCQLARYKDRLLLYCKLRDTFSYWFKNIDNRYDRVVYANFDLDDAVGFAGIDDIIPFGVI